MLDEVDSFEIPFVPTAEDGRAMRDFHKGAWRPETDSSDASPVGAELEHVLVLSISSDKNHPACACGCDLPLKNKRGSFLQGHDMRLRGKLSRAHAARIDIVLVEIGTGILLESMTALEYALRFNTAKVDWTIEVRDNGNRLRAKLGIADDDAPVADEAVLQRLGVEAKVRPGSIAA